MRELFKDALTFFVTMATAAGSYIASNYDKLAATLLSLAGLAFLFWRWRKSAKTQLCDTKSCPLRHDPNEE